MTVGQAVPFPGADFKDTPLLTASSTSSGRDSDRDGRERRLLLRFLLCWSRGHGLNDRLPVNHDQPWLPSPLPSDQGRNKDRRHMGQLNPWNDLTDWAWFSSSATRTILGTT